MAHKKVEKIKCTKCGHKLKQEIREGKKADKIGKVMEEFKLGTLHSGSKKGPKVKSKKQAIAIALNSARTMKRKNKSR